MKLQFSPVNIMFGNVGSGKTTVLCKIARQMKKKGVRICTNFPMKGAVLIDDSDIGHYNFEGCCLLLDECGISYSNRDFKKGLMSDHARLQYWKLVRHYHCMIIVASQSLDVDKKIRDLSERLFLVKRSILPFFTTIKPIFKKVDIDKISHQLIDSYFFGGITTWSWCFRRRYYKYFNSYDAPKLPDYDYESNYIPEDGEVMEISPDIPFYMNDNFICIYDYPDDCSCIGCHYCNHDDNYCEYYETNVGGD